jgi:ubiquitin carboxyl-terminal hydrolase 8
MSAAASLPSPPSGQPGHSTGNGNGARPPAFNPNAERPFEHIQDLQARAQDGISDHDPPAKLLSAAAISLQQAKVLLDDRRPDLAFVEYLRAYEIAIDVIPRSGKILDMDMDQGWDRQYKYVKSTLVEWNERYMKIKTIIENNNQRSGVLPRGYQAKISHARSQSESQRIYVTKAPYPQSNAEYQSPNVSGARKVKPSVSPKPESLHGRALSQGGVALNGFSRANPSDALNDRFARLRMPSGAAIDTTRPDSRGSNSSVHSSPISMPAADDWNGSYSFDAPIRSNGMNGKLLRPRGMPNGGPLLPAKLPLDTSFAAAMPKAPSPTYSPARNMHTTGNVAPPRHSARSLASSEYRRSSTASSVASLKAPNGLRDSGDYFPQTVPEDSRTQSTTTTRHSQRAKETRCNTERLFDYLPRFSVLLIDVRPRADFDQGHIYSQNVMCIEPMSLQPGMSAEQLLESLILSPDLEQEMFDDRHLFDLVVYYDADMQSDRYLSSPTSDREMKLKYLHEALHDFNQEKPLREPPMLLIGGIDAWVDLVGQQALATSSTLAKAKAGRPISRRPMATSGGSQLRLPKRRVQDFAPLNQDEQQAWLNQARQESVSAPQQPVLEEDEDGDENEEERERLSRAAIDEFNQRYPDASAIDSQPGFMGSQMPARRPPAPPAKIPDYPAAPPPSQYAQAPARPAPAAPRMSYTGVSERAASQGSFPGRSDGLMPYVPPKLRSSTMTLPKTGLINFGVTCYMNSTIQALSATTPLSILFLSDEYKRAVQKNWKGSEGVLPELYSNLIRSLWKGDVGAIKPATFRNFCGRLNGDWKNDVQQDAKQFLEFMIETLHEDLNSNFNRNILQNLTPQQEAYREQLPKYLASKREWQRHRHREHSPIYDLFGGQTMSRLRCRTCAFVSTTWEFFSSVSVEIPHNTPATLDQCLAQFCRDEGLRGEESWKCPRCNVTREATKQITFTRLPQYLVIHLKRFRNDDYGRVARKVHTVIDFPLRGLDMSPYTLPPPDAAEQQRIAQAAAPPELVPDPAMTPPYTYDAYAVLQHIGGDLTHGHYTTAVRDRMKKVWRKYNDTIVRDIEPVGLQNKEAYILFYERTVSAGDGGRL